MKNLRSTTLPFIVLGLVCLVVLSVYVFLWVMTGRAHGRVNALQSEVVLQEAREAHAQDTGRFINDIRDDGELVYSFFVSRANVVGAIETLESLEKSTGARVTITQVDARNQTADAPGTLVVGLSGTGSWKAVAHLLRLLETLPFQSQLMYVSLSTSPSTEGGSSWSLQARLEADMVE